MAEFKLGRIDLYGKVPGTQESFDSVDDVVRYGGRTYIRVVNLLRRQNPN